MLGLTRGYRLAVFGLTASLLLSGCVTRQPATQVQTTAPSPSQAYLSKPVAFGWLRTVGRSEGLVLVFDCQEVAAKGKDLSYRFVVFNEGSEVRAWDDALFVVNSRRADGYTDPDPDDEVVPSGLGLVYGDYPISYLGNYDFPGLVLRSGDSTTHAGKLSGREWPGNKPYLSLIAPSFKAGDRDRALILVSAPHVAVTLK